MVWLYASCDTYPGTFPSSWFEGGIRGKITLQNAKPQSVRCGLFFQVYMRARCWSLCHVRLKPETSASVALQTKLVLVSLDVVWLDLMLNLQLAAWPGLGDRMKQVITGMHIGIFTYPPHGVDAVMNLGAE